MGGKGIPQGSHSARKESPSGLHMVMLNLDFKSVASCNWVGRDVEQVFRLNRTQAVEDLITVDQIVSQETTLGGEEVQLLESFGVRFVSLAMHLFDPSTLYTFKEPEVCYIPSVPDRRGKVNNRSNVAS